MIVKLGKYADIREKARNGKKRLQIVRGQRSRPGNKGFAKFHEIFA